MNVSELFYLLGKSSLELDTYFFSDLNVLSMSDAVVM